MFGKKSASGKQKAKAPKQALEVNFFVAHGEKILLSLVGLGLAYLVYEGLGGKGYDPQRQPQQLSENADQLLQKIRSGDPWPELEKERAVAHNFAQRTDEARQPSDPSQYPLPVMEVQDKGAYQKRGDPELKAPIKVIGQSIVGMIAVEAPDNAADPFEDREDAKKLKGKAKESRRPGRGNTQPGLGSDAAGSADLASGGIAGGLGQAGPGGEMIEPKRLFPSTYNRGFPLGLAPGGMGMGSMGGMGGMDAAGGMMGASGMAGGVGAGGAATGGSLTGGPTIKPKKYHPKVMYFNAVTALVPHEELVKEYEAQLRESASYNPMRDRPIYLSFEVQRVEITARDQQINEGDWKPVTDATKQLALVRSWLPKFPMQQVPDVIDPMAADRALTIPLPPILIRDYRQFAKHPDIDWMWDAGMGQMQQIPNDPNQMKPPDDGGVLPGERGPIAGMGGMMGGGMDGSGMMGGMMGGMDGSGMMGSGMMGGGMMGMDGAGMMGAGSGMMGMDGSGMMGMDGSGMMGGMAGGMDGSGMMGGYGMMMLPPKFKMIRFFDVLSDKDVRKTYRYRVRVMMEDPNYPSDIWPAPRNQDLKDDVFSRVAKLRKKEDPEAEAVRKENLTAKPNTPRKVYNRTKRFTPWSEPSNGIYVVGNEDVFIGKFPTKRTNEPTADAVLVKLDQRGAYLPMFSFPTEGGKEEKRLPQFKRGAVLVYPKVTTQFAHPVTTVIKEWPDYQFNGGSTVVDIRGNEPLALSDAKDDPLTDNGEMMVWMSDGHVKVTNEYDDAFWYRAFTLADEREMMEKSGAAGFMGGGDMGGAGSLGSGSSPIP